MQIPFSRCCGLDVHKDSVTACVLVYSGSAEPEVRKKQFETHWKALGNLRLWLFAQKVTHVAMESTGVYWKPVWQALEGHFQLILGNPYQIKNIPGRKADRRDSQWIAQLLAHGLIRPSFVPPPQTRQLRDWTRYRVKLSEEKNRIHNRIHKVLEDACLKLDTVASDILGVSGRAIIQAIVEGVESPNFLAERAKGRMGKKIPQLRLALRGRITAHHRELLRELMEDLEFVERKIAKLDQTIRGLVDQTAVDRLCSIPGVDQITAWTILAELGTDMTVFEDAKHAASWAGLCPGNHESAGKRLSNRTRKGNRWLRRGLCQSAWAASHTKNCYLSAFFYRKAATRGERKAIIATAHHILVIAYCLLRDQTVYRELG
jgi:transposase